MLYVSIFTSDRERDPELWATIWQGTAPPTLKLLAAYNLGDDRRVFIWEGEGAADLQPLGVDRADHLCHRWRDSLFVEVELASGIFDPPSVHEDSCRMHHGVDSR